MFKYAQKKHALQLINLGVLRVGTLHDYQSAQHGIGIHDSDEGKKTLTYSAIEPIDIEIGRRGDSKILDDFGIKYEVGARFTAFGKNVKFIRNQSNEDCFLYCVSSEASKKAIAELEGADTCIEITDIEAFLEVLTATLNSVCAVNFVEFNRVEYIGRQSIWHPKYHTAHPAWIKEPELSPQQEWRAIWTPVAPGPISPIITGHKRFTSLVRRVEV